VRYHLVLGRSLGRESIMKPVPITAQPVEKRAVG
jgi:hypothetical protein